PNTGSLDGSKVRVLPLDAATMQEMLLDPDTGWATAYLKYLNAAQPERAQARMEWADRTSELLKELSQRLMQPILAGLDDHANTTDLVIAPGRLAGLPLHAASLADGRCVAETLASAASVPNISVLPAAKRSWAPPTSALCIL